MHERVFCSPLVRKKKKKLQFVTSDDNWVFAPNGPVDFSGHCTSEAFEDEVLTLNAEAV